MHARRLPQLPVAQRPDKQPGDDHLDSGDRDSLVPAPRKPTPPLNADAIAIPEPIQTDPVVAPSTIEDHRGRTTFARGSSGPLHSRDT